MPPLVEDVHRTGAIAADLIGARATAVGAARHRVEMATVRTRLGRVRFTDCEQWDAVTTELVC
jgi:hypothetical protein